MLPVSEAAEQAQSNIGLIPLLNSFTETHLMKFFTPFFFSEHTLIIISTQLHFNQTRFIGLCSWLHEFVWMLKQFMLIFCCEDMELFFFFFNFWWFNLTGSAHINKQSRDRRDIFIFQNQTEILPEMLYITAWYWKRKTPDLTVKQL